MKKKDPAEKYRCTSYTYPPQLDSVIRKLLDEQLLSKTVSKLLATAYGVDLEKPPEKPQT